MRKDSGIEAADQRVSRQFVWIVGIQGGALVRRWAPALVNSFYAVEEARNL